MIKPEFPSAKSLGDRDWGTESLLVSSSSKWMMKKLIIKEGFKGGLQYHRLKDEGGIIIQGRLLVRFAVDREILKEVILEPGDCFRFPPGCIHQEEALTDVMIIECSTPHLNDRVRVEQKYGLDPVGGLPTTSLKDIRLI